MDHRAWLGLWGGMCAYCRQVGGRVRDGGVGGFLYTVCGTEHVWAGPAHRGSASHAVSCALLYRHGLGHLGSHFYMGLRTIAAYLLLYPLLAQTMIDQ